MQLKRLETPKELVLDLASGSRKEENHIYYSVAKEVLEEIISRSSCWVVGNISTSQNQEPYFKHITSIEVKYSSVFVLGKQGDQFDKPIYCFDEIINNTAILWTEEESKEVRRKVIEERVENLERQIAELKLNITQLNKQLEKMEAEAVWLGPELEAKLGLI